MATLLAVLSLFSIMSAIIFYNGGALKEDASGSASVFSQFTLGNLGAGGAARMCPVFAAESS
jgi:hypothetical protein